MGMQCCVRVYVNVHYVLCVFVRYPVLHLFGMLYVQATLKNETVVAVKKLDMKYNRAKADFESEVRLISNVHHRNLVRLLGCCTKGSDLLLVYEFMENKSLDIFLYGMFQLKCTIRSVNGKIYSRRPSVVETSLLDTYEILENFVK